MSSETPSGTRFGPPHHVVRGVRYWLSIETYSPRDPFWAGASAKTGGASSSETVESGMKTVDLFAELEREITSENLR